MRRTNYLGAYGQKSDPSIRSGNLDFYNSSIGIHVYFPVIYPFLVRISNPIHQLVDPIQSNP